MTTPEISDLIDRSPMNRGMNGKAWLANYQNIAIEKHGNVFLFERESQQAFEFHWLVLETKSRQAIRDTQDAMREVFETTNAQVIFGFVPNERRESALMARWVGAKFCGIVTTEHGYCQLFVITADLLGAK